MDLRYLNCVCVCVCVCERERERQVCAAKLVIHSFESSSRLHLTRLISLLSLKGSKPVSEIVVMI
jgi:hypothetical protein